MIILGFVVAGSTWCAFRVVDQSRHKPLALSFAMLLLTFVSIATTGSVAMALGVYALGLAIVTAILAR